jgi:vacuolar-type H+-ATPase subunit I/STV1
MSGLDDQGIAAAIGAAIAGAGAALVEVFRRKKRRSDPPEQIEDATPTTAARVGRLTERVMRVEQEIQSMRQRFTEKLDKVEESVDTLIVSRAKTDELLPLIREQLKEIRDELRDNRRHTTHKE